MQEIATYIKERLDKEYATTWHVIVGRSFGEIEEGEREEREKRERRRREKREREKRERERERERKIR